MHLFLSSVSAQELQKYEQFIFADYTSVIQVENVYEEILYQTLLEETLKGEDTLEVTVIAFWPLASGELLLLAVSEPGPSFPKDQGLQCYCLDSGH